MTRRRKFFWIGLISLAALALLVAVAPWFANIGPVRRLAELEIGKVFGRGRRATTSAATTLLGLFGR